MAEQFSHFDIPPTFSPFEVRNRSYAPNSKRLLADTDFSTAIVSIADGSTMGDAEAKIRRLRRMNPDAPSDAAVGIIYVWSSVPHSEEKQQRIKQRFGLSRLDYDRLNYLLCYGRVDPKKANFPPIPKGEDTVVAQPIRAVDIQLSQTIVPPRKTSPDIVLSESPTRTQPPEGQEKVTKKKTGGIVYVHNEIV